MIEIGNVVREIELLEPYITLGKVVAVKGLLIEVSGIEHDASIGSVCEIRGSHQQSILAEVIGMRDDRVMLMPYDRTVGIGLGSQVRVMTASPLLFPQQSWLGRVLNAFGQPIDGKGALPKGIVPYHLHAPPPPAHSRRKIGKKLNLSIRAINAFLSCCEGQRMGIFAGSGVGKSMTLTMIAQGANSDVTCIALIGERGREVQQFLEDLGEMGLEKAIIVVATSDESAPIRKQAAYTAMSICEYFRDQGASVLCMVDSITRFAMAQREIGLAAGEPPTTKGYPPSVFSELPKLLERAGPGAASQGDITGLFTVLVEGDDHNEPIADAVRSIVDGHIVLSRSIAQKGVYPAVNVLESVSRMLPRCNSERENRLVNRARKLLADYIAMADLIQIGAYKKGTDPNIDEAIKYHQAIEEFLMQDFKERDTIESSYAKLAAAINFE